MESVRIENLLEKYFEGLTSLAEERELSSYFTSDKVAPHLEQYREMFGYFAAAREESPVRQLPLETKRKPVITAWLSIAASAVVLLGVGSYALIHNSRAESLGTFDNPELAYQETQKALSLLSGHINQGVESVQYVEVYEEAKSRTILLK